MGFTANLLVLKPVEKDFGFLYYLPEGKKACLLWHIETILHLGRITKPILCKTARQRAALHFFSSFFGELTTHASNAGKECLAAPFAIRKGIDEIMVTPFSRWEKKFKTKEGKPNTFIKPLCGGMNHRQIPSLEMMFRHNQALPKCKGFGPKNDIVMEVPLVWVPCQLLAEWISKGESESFLKLKTDDPEAAAYFIMWKSCIVEMGKVGCNTLFLFDDVQVPDVI